MTPHLLAAVWAATLLSVSGGEAIPDPPVVAPLLAADTMRAHFIDVEQADAALLEFPTGAIMIDAGAASDEDVTELLSYLDEFFQRRTDLNRTLDSVIITHNHVDHTRGLREVLRRSRSSGSSRTVHAYPSSGLHLMQANRFSQPVTIGSCHA